MAACAASGAAGYRASFRRRDAGRALGRPAGGDGVNFGKHGPVRRGPSGRGRGPDFSESHGTGKVRSAPSAAGRRQHFAGGAAVRRGGRLFPDSRGNGAQAGVGGGGAVGDAAGGGKL
ncbi:hypothetical protein SDC9_125064 [bioreactor metagenome]|uniref:Uncharacterized protein n=1 Tax=bioreactor metagenome TaxID=1076179 RepID=A0A645CME3_9ZZZZ